MLGFGCLGELSLGGAPSEAAVATALLPDSDITLGGWTNESGGSSLFDHIDELVFDDADYIRSSVSPVIDLCKVSLSNPGGAPAAPVTINYRYWKQGTNNINLQFRLLQGATQIKSWTHNAISTTPTAGVQTLTAPEFASVTDWNDLFIEITANP